MDTAQQLKFIVDFANRDLKDTREGDWINLQDDLRNFFPTEGEVYPGLILFDARVDPEIERYPKLKLEPLQKDLHLLLQVATKPAFADMAGPIQINVEYCFISGGWLNVMGKVRDLFLQAVINLLSDPETSSKFRPCPECQKFFLRVRRQVYCSPPCADKAIKREWLKTPKGKQYLRKAKKKRRGR